jgi:hypothetical protein
MALVDLSLCSLYLRGIEDLKNSSHIEVPAFYPILNEGESYLDCRRNFYDISRLYNTFNVKIKIFVQF